MKAKLLVGLVALMASLSVGAQTRTGVTTITKIGTGWSADVVSIRTAATIPNPAGCAQSDIILMDVNTVAYKTHYAAILTAFSSGSQIELVVSNTVCSTYGRPQLIGLEIQ